MRTFRPIRRRGSEKGIALLIAIFVLLLISVVGIAVVVSSDTESHLTGNYRSSTEAYYDALAGVEEARARLRPNDPNSFKNTWAAFYTPPGTTLPIGTVGYVLNPSPTDNAGAMLTTYPDTEYDNEFGPGALGAANVQTTQSVWNIGPLNGLPFPGPLYKWVRINAVSEKSINLDVDADGLADSTTPLYYDSANRVFSNNPGAGSQALELTALAVLPNGSQKLLQYMVAPIPLSLAFPGALILDGTTPQFGASPSAGFYIKGIDQGSVGTCNPGPLTYTAVGYTDASYTAANFEQPGNAQGIPSALHNNYTNGVAPNPDVATVTVSPNLSTVGGLNNLVQAIQQNADVVVNGNATQTGGSGPLPSTMSATNPLTIVINGDFTFSGWRNTGYGLLLVTGNLTYDPDADWDGIILVIGKGSMSSHQGSYTTTFIQGAVLIANTVGLPASSPPASSSFNFFATPNTLTNGIYYSSCWIQNSLPSSGYKILSFHEISQ